MWLWIFPTRPSEDTHEKTCGWNDFRKSSRSKIRVFTDFVFFLLWSLNWKFYTRWKNFQVLNWGPQWCYNPHERTKYSQRMKPTVPLIPVKCNNSYNIEYQIIIMYMYMIISKVLWIKLTVPLIPVKYWRHPFQGPAFELHSTWITYDWNE